MKNRFSLLFLLTSTILLAASTFSCQAERVIPVERFEKSIEGSWEIGPIVLRTDPVHEFASAFSFDEVGIFEASNKDMVLWAGPFVISKPEDGSGNQYLILYTGAKTSKTYLIRDFTRNRLSLVPAEEIGTGNVYHYEKK